uniref:Uncharacterized protein n=1 Tax=Anguilla anguilla TaxID=7936 RepID=A0A0E9XRQ7_ANGAN
MRRQLCRWGDCPPCYSVWVCPDSMWPLMEVLLQQKLVSLCATAK